MNIKMTFATINQREDWGHAWLVVFSIGMSTCPSYCLVYSDDSEEVIDMCFDYLSEHMPGVFTDDSTHAAPCGDKYVDLEHVVMIQRDPRDSIIEALKHDAYRVIDMT